MLHTTLYECAYSLFAIFLLLRFCVHLVFHYFERGDKSQDFISSPELCWTPDMYLNCVFDADT